MSARDESIRDFVERLGTDQRFREEFRSDPYRTASEHGIGRKETDAILHGDVLDLARLGIDVEQLTPKEPASWFPSMLLRTGGATAAALIAIVAVFGMTGKPASAATRRFVSIRRVRASGRARARARARWVAHPVSARAVRARFVNGRGDGSRTGGSAVRVRYYRASSWDGGRTGGEIWGRYNSEDDALQALGTVLGELTPVEFNDGEEPQVVE